jgi:hypothetical protein
VVQNVELRHSRMLSYKFSARNFGRIFFSMYLTSIFACFTLMCS